MQRPSRILARRRRLRLGAGLAAAAAIGASATPVWAEQGIVPPVPASHSALSGTWIAEHPQARVYTAEGKLPPLKPDAMKAYRQRLAARKAGDTSFDRATWCASPGLPRAMFMPYPFEIVMDSRRVAFLYQWFRLYRTVDLSGLKQDVPYPISMGYGMGRWDDDALAVDTIGLLGDTTLDAAGLPHSEDIKLSERLRLLGHDVLEDRITVEDPANYAKPWTTVMIYRRLPGAHVQDDVCLDRIAAGEPAVRGNGQAVRAAKRGRR